MKNRIIPLTLFFFSLAALGFGIWSGEVSVLFQKAVSICLSCIGIG